MSKKKLLGVKRRDIHLDFDLYRIKVPIPGVANANLSVLDLWPENSANTILFLHGFAGVLESWEFQINFFERQSYRVIAPDLRGHGQSDAPYSNYTMDELVSDLQAIVEYLNIEKFILVAHSFGGSIATEYANAHPEHLEKLVLIATAGEFPLPWFAKLLLKLPLTWLQPLWKFRRRWDAELHVVMRMMTNNLAKWRGWDSLRKIQTPTLIVTGERDNYFPRHVFDDVGSSVPGAEIYDVGTAKHKVQLERHQAVNRAILRFVTGDQTRSWRRPDESVETSLSSGRPWVRHYDTDVPQTIPIPRRPLHTFLASTASWLPKRTALIFFGKKFSYQELYADVKRLAANLHGRGIQPGDRIMIVLPNMPEMVIALFATLQIGAIAVLPNPDADRYRLAQQVKETKPKLLITINSFGQVALSIQSETGFNQFIFINMRKPLGTARYRSLRMIWGMDRDFDADHRAAEALGEDFATMLQETAVTAKPPDVRVHHTDLAVILYTSGTTGQPKGVCLTHHNLVANTLQTRHWAAELEYGKETCLAAVPFLHSYGLVSAMSVPIALGATIVLLPIFQVQDALEAIRDYQVTLFPGAPSMYAAINQAPNVREYGLRTIKACISGSEPLPVEIQESFEKLTLGKLVEGYGLTEASPVTHANPLTGKRKSGSIGLPIPNTEVKIVDLKSGEELPVGQIGEMLVRGPQIMAGYWIGEDEVPDREPLTADGWLKTGDVGVQDSEGYFHLINRKKHLIYIDSEIIFPRDIEEVLYENSKVFEAAVISIADPEDPDTNQIKAIVVPRPGQEITAEELLPLCKRRLPPLSVPSVFEFRDHLPRSLVGKLLRHQL
ncbi:MAG: alpha/beta fold hydrolase [Ardenticatenaceae bacterium]|nr:alpha/beta fold hydrolase [Ardenticatenaceae bacterium]